MRGFFEDYDYHLANVMVITKLLEFVWFLTFLVISWWYSENTNADIKSNREDLQLPTGKKKNPTHQTCLFKQTRMLLRILTAVYFSR